MGKCLWPQKSNNGFCNQSNHFSGSWLCCGCWKSTTLLKVSPVVLGLSDYPSLGVRVCTFQQQWLLGFNLCCQWRVIVWLKPRPKRTRNSGTLSPAGLQSRSSFNLVLFHSLCPTGLTAWLLAADAALSGVFAGLLRPRRKSRARGPDQTAPKFGPAVRPGSNLGAASHWKIDGSCCPSIKTSYSLPWTACTILSNGGQFFFSAGFVFSGLMLSCFSDFLLFCFSAYIASLLFLLLCFLLSLLLCFSCFSAFLLFAFPASLLFSASLFFPASLLLYFCAFLLLLFYFSFLQSCVFAAVLPAPLLLCFLSLLSLCFSLSLLYPVLFVS